MKAIRCTCGFTFGLLALLAWQPDPAMLGRLYEEALERKKQEYGASDARTMQAARDLGLFLSKHGPAAGARKVLTDVVRLDESALGPAGAQTLTDVASLASVSPPAMAEPLWRRAGESSDPAVAARAFAALGQLREAAGDPPGAAGFYAQAMAKEELALQQANTIEEKARLAILMSGVAQVLGQIAEPTQGAAVLRRALAIDRSVLGPRHPETATTQANLAGVLLDANAVNESVQLITEAIAILEESLGADHPRVGISASILGHGLRAKGDFVQAERNYRRALAVDERAHGPKHPQTLEDVRTLAEFLRERGKIQEASVLERRLASVAQRKSR
jgi:tetratricopeptide (TPR) repeat protein